MDGDNIGISLPATDATVKADEVSPDDRVDVLALCTRLRRVAARMPSCYPTIVPIHLSPIGTVSWYAKQRAAMAT